MEFCGWKRVAALLWAGASLWLGGCASTGTEVSNSSELLAHEGLVVMRFVDVGDVPVTRFTVQAEGKEEEFPLRSIRFGQTMTKTYIGRLPAGRYAPKTLTGSKVEGAYTRRIEVPLAKLTGQFDVEAGRVTQLGTMVFVQLESARPALPLIPKPGSSSSSSFNFVLPLDPTPVPVEPMLAARFPQLAKVAAGKPPLGWVSGSLPSHSPLLVDLARRLVRAANHPTLLDENTVLAGGSLYWVIKGVILVRQKIVAIDDVTDNHGPRCGLYLDKALVRTAPAPRRAFQGWRYLEPNDAPADLASLGGAENLPEELRRQLVELGAW